jgi:hypothetical protein
MQLISQDLKIIFNKNLLMPYSFKPKSLKVPTKTFSLLKHFNAFMDEILHMF